MKIQLRKRRKEDERLLRNGRKKATINLLAGTVKIKRKQIDGFTLMGS